VLFGLVSVACASTASVARAQGGLDEVDLVDGTALHGKITQQVPGSYVVIQTTDGRVESIPWSQVKRVRASAPTPPPPVPSSPPSPPPASAPPAPAPPVVAPVVAVATPAAAEPSADSTATAKSTPRAEVRFEMGARLGYSFAAGDYVSGTSLTSSSASMLLPGVTGGGAFTLDLGMRISRYVYVGGFFSYSLLGTSCLQANPGYSISCDAHDIRAGIDAQVHVQPRGAVDPWFGFGLGHDWLTVSVSGSGQGNSASVSQTLDGWNFAHFMLGIDFRMGKGGGLGPYLELTSGNYASASASATGSQSASASIEGSSQSSHQWVTLGLRGTYEVL
jgi:hypothetical protein